MIVIEICAYVLQHQELCCHTLEDWYDERLYNVKKYKTSHKSVCEFIVAHFEIIYVFFTWQKRSPNWKIWCCYFDFIWCNDLQLILWSSICSHSHLICFVLSGNKMQTYSPYAHSYAHMRYYLPIIYFSQNSEDIVKIKWHTKNICNTKWFKSL